MYSSPNIMDFLERVKNIIRDYMEERTTHDYEHTLRVFQTASILAIQENADLELVQISALLHDIGRNIDEPHNETGAEKAREILEELQYPKERIKQIEKIVLYHSFSSKDKLATLEEKIIWDADKLDGLGAIGISRAFYMRGEKSYPFNDFSWFKEDTTLRYTSLNTESAKKVAKQRYDYMKNYFAILRKELESTDILNILN